MIPPYWIMPIGEAVQGAAGALTQSKKQMPKQEPLMVEAGETISVKELPPEHSEKALVHCMPEEAVEAPHIEMMRLFKQEEPEAQAEVEKVRI